MSKRKYKLSGVRIKFKNMVLGERLSGDKFRLAKKIAEIESELLEPAGVEQEEVKVVGRG